MMITCPNCRVITAVNDNVGDFVHNCNTPAAPEAYKKEDFPRLGNSEGDDIVSEKQGDIVSAGLPDKAGVRSRLEGIKIPELSRRGNNVSTTRERSHFEYIQLS